MILERIAEFYRRTKRPRLFSDPYPSWKDARRACSGYQTSSIVEAHFRAAQLVQEGKYVFERDSICFDEVEYEAPMLVALGSARALTSGSLRVLDVGGALGSKFFQYRELRNVFNVGTWHIVETQAMVAASRQLHSEPGLSFSSTLDTTEGEFDLILLGSSLQYLDAPEEALTKLSALGTAVMIVDRIPVWRRDEVAPVVQSVPRGIHQGSYPCWIFTSMFLREALGPKWKSLFTYDAVGGVWATKSGVSVRWAGEIFLIQ